MAINQPRLCLVCYDIADPRRLLRVHRYLRETGLPVQYSVFAIRLTPRQLALLLQDLNRRIEPREDDVRIYPLPEHGERLNIGKQFFPADVLLLADGGHLILNGVATSGT